MKFNKLQSLLVENISTDNWKKLLSSNKMLSSAVEILNKLTSKGFSAYIVGGAVRDMILGDDPKDIDIATNMPADKVEAIFKTHDIGKNKDFGIVVVEYNGMNFEIANYRQDGVYQDGRRPETVTIVKDFKTDASRRDFTINALGIDKDGNIIDYFDGKGDIKNKTLRTVGNAIDRMEEDKLRLLRAVRFSSKLGFKMDDELVKAIKAKSPEITKIAMERITDELRKMAGYGGDKFADAIKTMDEIGLLQYILPEVVKMKEFEHTVETHPEGGVLSHVLAALKTSTSKDPIVNLSILLHDIGKIATRSYNDLGRVQYLQHAKEGVDLVDQIGKRLKMSTDEIESIKFATLNHMKFHDILDMKNSTIVNLLRDKNFDILKDVALADTRARGHLFNQADWDKVIDKIERVTSMHAEAVHLHKEDSICF